MSGESWLRQDSWWWDKGWLKQLPVTYNAYYSVQKVVGCWLKIAQYKDKSKRGPLTK